MEDTMTGRLSHGSGQTTSTRHLGETITLAMSYRVLSPLAIMR